MKIIISAPTLWMTLLELPDYVIGCLRRRNIDASPTSVEVKERPGLTTMVIESAEGLSGQKRLAAEAGINEMNDVLIEGNRDSFGEDLRKWSDQDRKKTKKND